jgi:tripartite-type tricarboxylate transporter receptor subunit TctC
VVPFAEQGFAGFEALTYWVMVGPAGIAPEVTARMHQAIARVLAEPQVQARMADQGAEILANAPPAAEAFIRAEIAKWGEVIRTNNITADG